MKTEARDWKLEAKNQKLETRDHFDRFSFVRLLRILRKFKTLVDQSDQSTC